ncbi:MAG TPA: hypothetical protein VK906_11465 [Egicoccus sp.]|nr:hypothetical protein [Egicoccus sp.]HSK23790.1 hypothetical protein [Egicoccus sp.]
MTATIRWDEHERDLLPLLDVLAADEPPTPLLACFTDGVAGWMLLGRRQRQADDVDPVTELAVVAAEMRPQACVLATPVRVRDIGAEDAPTVARTWVLLSAVLRGGGADLRTRQLPVEGLGAASDLDVEVSPAASVFDDAVRHRLGADPVHVLYAACRWGHELAFPANAADDGSAPVPADEAAGTGREAEAARYRLQRHAADLAARHRPTASWKRALDRPAVHADTPHGWVPACPL